MKLPKQIPVKLLYVLLVIFLWSSIMDKSSDTKEDFDMKDVKNMLMDKLMGKKDDKEDFEPFDKEEEKQSVTPWSTLHGSPIQQ